MVWEDRLPVDKKRVFWPFINGNTIIWIRERNFWQA